MEDIKKPNNPFAFACITESYGQEGMTLRDYSALKFINGYVSGSLDVIGHGMNFDMNHLVRLSFEFADEFLKQREL